jgi:hypothetical protein
MFPSIDEKRACNLEWVAASIGSMVFVPGAPTRRGRAAFSRAFFFLSEEGIKLRCFYLGAPQKCSSTSYLADRFLQLAPCVVHELDRASLPATTACFG